MKIDYEIVGISEWFIDAIECYAAIHCKDIDVDVPQDIKEVDEYLSTGKNRSFFEQYFHPQDLSALYGSFADVQDRLLDVNTLTNKIASEFYIDPEHFSQGMNQTVTSVEQAKAKLQEFRALTDEIRSKPFGYSAESNVEIGQYVERLNLAKSELDALGQQGLITADELKTVQEAFNKAKYSLEDKISYYDGYGSGYGDYHYSYEDEYGMPILDVETQAFFDEDPAKMIGVSLYSLFNYEYNVYGYS